MVAGMLMPLDSLRAIYERLFRDGVMVAKKDKRPQTKHPEIPGVGNLQVIRAMGSLKSRGFVRETFAWRHFYWYLTNEGIVYLRDYLHLPPEIVPTPLQRVRRPAATLSIVQRAARVQTVEGPTSYVSKPGRVGAESQEALLERQGYRHKRMQTEEEPMSSEKTSRFRGRPITIDYSKSKAYGESRDQFQPKYEVDQGIGHIVKKKIISISHQPPAKISSATSLVQTMSEGYKGTNEASQIKNTPKSMDLPAQIAVTAETVEVSASMSTSKAVKPKEEICIRSTTDLINTKTAKDTAILPKSKEQAEQTLKVTKTKNIQEHLVEEKMPENTKTCISITSSTPHPVELKPVTKAQETISKPAKDANGPPSYKGQIEKSQRVSEVKNIQEHPVNEEMPQNTETYQELVTSESPKDISLSSHSNSLVEKNIKVSETQNVKEHPIEMKISKNTEAVSISSTSTVPHLVELKPKVKGSQEPKPSNPTKHAPVVASKQQVKVAQMKNEQQHPIKDEMPKNAETCICTTTSTNEPVELKAKYKASQDVIISEPAKETSVPLSSNKPVEKTAKVTKIKNIQKHPAKDEMTKNTETNISTSSTCTFQSVELMTKTTQELFTSEPLKDALMPSQSKKQEGKSLKVIKTKSSQEHLVKDEMPQNSEANISMSASSVPVTKAQTKDVTDLDTSENTKEIKEKDDTGISLGSAASCVSKTNKDTTVNFVVDVVKEKAEVCLVQQTSEASLAEQTGKAATESAVPQASPLTVIPSNVQKSKKSQKTSIIKETNRDTQMASKDIKPVQVNPKEEEIPSQESSTTVTKTESKVLKHDTKPVMKISDAAAVEQVKEVIMHEEIKVVEQTKPKLKKMTKHEITSVQQMPPPIKLLEESEAKVLKKNEAEVAPTTSRRKKKKQSAADKQVPSSAAEISAAEEMVSTQVAVKIHSNQRSELFAMSESSKICTEDSSQTAAVHCEAPIHKGEVEPAQPSAEKIKREVLKEKTSSSQQLREAPTAKASATTQAGPYPEHGDPPSVAQHSAAPDTHSRREKQKVLSVSKAIKNPVTTGPLTAEEQQVLAEDEAAMRKKIVVVEEVIEVQQIATPGAEGSQPVVPPAPEVPGDDLDYDVLEELAKERTVFQSPVKELVWDHSLDEPEPKTFPNFIEGRVKTKYLLSFLCMCYHTATVRVSLWEGQCG
ncbi:plectin isoform X1 [Tachysurus ichikawai]